MIEKVDICLLRRGDVVRFEDLELAETWIVEKIDNDKIFFELNTILFKKEKILKINQRRKKYVFVEVDR